MKKRWSTPADFVSAHLLQFIKYSCLRPSRILRHSLEGFGTISSIHVKLECLRIWLAHTQFSWSATLPAVVYGAYVTNTRLPLFLSCMLKRSESLEMRVAKHKKASNRNSKLPMFSSIYTGGRFIHAKTSYQYLEHRSQTTIGLTPVMQEVAGLLQLIRDQSFSATTLGAHQHFMWWKMWNHCGVSSSANQKSITQKCTSPKGSWFNILNWSACWPVLQNERFGNFQIGNKENTNKMGGGAQITL